MDLTEVGAHRYCSHPSLEIILVGYAYGDDPIKVWEPLSEPIPKDLEEGLDDPLQIIAAWNGPGFDRLAFAKKLGKSIDIERWEDLMVRSRYMSMPGSQGKVADILEIKTRKLVENVSTGQSVIDFFCSPLWMGGEITLFGLEPTHWRDKTTHPKEWNMLRNRVITDVEGMREIYYRLSQFPLPDKEYEFFAASERVNDRGVYTDSVLLHGAAFVGEKEQETLKKEFFDLTGIIKPKAQKAVLRFAREHGYTFSSLNKQFVNRALNGECNLDSVGRRALELRLKLGKSALAKLDTIKECVQEDGRVRGLFNFMGAARTHRDSSALVQLQNLIKPSKEVEKKYDLALQLLKKADYDGIKKNFTSPVDVAAAAIRPIFRASPGNKLLIADLSAIEVRGSAWLAGCSKMEQMFRDHEIDCGFPDDESHRCCNGRDPYISFACLMDPDKTYEKVYRDFKNGNKKIRTEAKPPMLGNCYGLSAGEVFRDEEGNLASTGLLAYAKSMGIELTPQYSEDAVRIYRNEYSEVCDFWYDLHRAFVNVIENDASVEIGPLFIEKRGRVLCMHLPSGDELHYINPDVQYEDAVSKKGNSYKRSIIWVDGIDQQTHQWGRIQTRGAKIFENAVQSICRGILYEGHLEAERRGIPIVLKVHDELVAEVPENGNIEVDDLIDCMVQKISWAPGLIISAEGFESPFYTKN